jgi:hypothetical protein
MKREYEKLLESLPPEELDTDDYPHQDDPTEEELRALGEPIGDDYAERVKQLDQLGFPPF